MKIAFCVIIADSRNNVLEGFGIVGVKSVFHPTADKIAEYTTEVFVTGVGDEASGVGKHSDEATENPKVAKCTELSLHAVLLVVEPPAGAELDL